MNDQTDRLVVLLIVMSIFGFALVAALYGSFVYAFTWLIAAYVGGLIAVGLVRLVTR